MNAEQIQLDIIAFKKNPTSESFYNIVRKYGAPYKVSDRGAKYYKDLVSKYLQGLPINDDKLLILLGLNIYGSNLTDYDIEVDDELIEEIKSSTGIDPNDLDVFDNILYNLFKGGWIIDNPLYIPAFNDKLGLMIKDGVITVSA